jgi:hypothetical protein
MSDRPVPPHPTPNLDSLAPFPHSSPSTLAGEIGTFLTIGRPPEPKAQPPRKRSGKRTAMG